MKRTLRALWSNDFVKGGAVFTLASFIANILNYVFNMLAARALGPEGYGEIAALFSYASVVSVPILVTTYIIVEKVASKGQGGRAFALATHYWFLANLKKWWPLLLLAIMLSPAIPAITNLAPSSAYVLIPYVLLNMVSVLYGSILQGLRMFGWMALFGIVGACIKLTGPIFALWGMGRLSVVLAMLLLSIMIPALLSYKKLFGILKGLDRSATNISKPIRTVLAQRQVIITFVSLLAYTAFLNLDIMYVKKTFTAAQAGTYGSWSLLSRIILYVTGPISTIGFTYFASKKSEHKTEKVLYGSLILLCVISLCSYVVYTQLSKIGVTIFFGNKFDSIIPYLGYASLFGALYTAVGFFNNFFLAKKDSLALIPALLSPIYLFLLFYQTHTLSDVMRLNVWFMAGLTGVYIVAYVYKFTYNGGQWKKGLHTT